VERHRFATAKTATNEATHTGFTPDIAINFAASDAPTLASPNGVSAADTNQLAIAIAVMKLGPTNASFHTGRHRVYAKTTAHHRRTAVSPAASIVSAAS
jgi:hypothetical protein